MTVLLPALFDEHKGNILVFVEDIEYVEEHNGTTTMILKSNVEIEILLSLKEVQKRIEAANLKLFKFN